MDEGHGVMMNHRAVDVRGAGLLYIRSMSVDVVQKRKRPVGEPCCDPIVHPDIDETTAQRIAAMARALSDPIRVQLVDVLRRHAGKVCVCELTPLFEVSQPTVSHHLKVLREAGLIDVERHGLWSYYYVIPEATKELESWLR